MNIRIDPADGRYDYSKLYFCTEPAQKFAEERCICFRVQSAGTVQRVRLLVPDAALTSCYLKFRVEALPYSDGVAEVESLGLATAAADTEALSRTARLRHLKQQTREGVVQSEAEGRVWLPHYPESLTLELTPRCNLTCSHCSSHGTPELHRLNNRRSHMSLDRLERLAHDVFPSLTQITLVGRGEPLVVPAPLWSRFIDLVREYDVLLSCVTNGTLVRDRIDSDNISLIETLTFSVDGMTEDTFARNRGGASLSVVEGAIGYYDDLRRRSGVARRPRLGLSWTLKRNNVHELPRLAAFARRFEADYLYIRHLLVFRDSDRPESLVDDPETANAALRELYALLADTPMKLDCPPLAVVPP